MTVQHVRRLAESGELTKLARGLIDRGSIDRYLSEGRSGRTPVWAERTAWGAIAILSGENAAWLGGSQASHLRGTLRHLTSATDLLVRTRDGRGSTPTPATLQPSPACETSSRART